MPEFGVNAHVIVEAETQEEADQKLRDLALSESDPIDLGRGVTLYLHAEPAEDLDGEPLDASGDDGSHGQNRPPEAGR